MPSVVASMHLYVGVCVVSERERARERAHARESARERERARECVRASEREGERFGRSMPIVVAVFAPVCWCVRSE
jgi:hypothetical protein